MVEEHNCAKSIATFRSVCYNTLRKEKSRGRTHCQMNVDQGRLFTEGGGRGSLKTAHSDVAFCILRHAVLDEEPDEIELDHDCLSEEKIDEAPASDSDSALQAQSNDENRIFRVSESGRRASQRGRSNFSLLP